ncbi:MAG: hypothetical protein FJ271_15125 [Planctomycetes bacterium]|nr:hypothetical protein [Planctomycetota bacterium]
MSLPNLDAIPNGIQPDTTQLMSNGWPLAWLAVDPDALATSPEAVYEAAIKYIEAGLSVIPIDAQEPSKSPDPRRLRSWQVYQIRPPRLDEVRAWYERGGPFGLAVIGGGVSGKDRGHGLEIIDFDTLELAAPWIEKVEESIPELTAKLVMIQSPRPGLHCYYRCRQFGGNQKLACAAAVSNPPTKNTLIELKAEGGYCLVCPSPRRCHPRNGLYRLLDGSPDLTQIPVITPEERAVLLDAARSFNRWTEHEAKPVRPVARNAAKDGKRPGDDFERRSTWSDILVPHGWVLVRRRGEIEDWRRPGKDDGISATINYAGSGLLYVFSTNGYPFEEGRGYSKFSAFAALNHDSDFVKAAQALQEKGFGPPQLPSGKRHVSGGVRIASSETTVREGQ